MLFKVDFRNELVRSFSRRGRARARARASTPEEGNCGNTTTAYRSNRRRNKFVGLDLSEPRLRPFLPLSGKKCSYIRSKKGYFVRRLLGFLTSPTVRAVYPCYQATNARCNLAATGFFAGQSRAKRSARIISRSSELLRAWPRTGETHALIFAVLSLCAATRGEIRRWIRTIGNIDRDARHDGILWKRFNLDERFKSD